jgi:hypothetical protein
MLVAGMLMVAATSIARSQSPPAMTESRVRAFAREALREAKSDQTSMVLALDRRIRERWGDFESFPISLVRSEMLLVTVTAPYLSFRRSLVDILRTGRSIDQAVWTGAVVVDIAPRRLDAPDIESVALSRGGLAVTPLKATLRPMTFSDGNGQQTALHAGEVHFPPAAFAPGATVTITLACRGRDPIVYAFDDEELSTLR